MRLKRMKEREHHSKTRKAKEMQKFLQERQKKQRELHRKYLRHQWNGPRADKQPPGKKFCSEKQIKTDKKTKINFRTKGRGSESKANESQRTLKQRVPTKRAKTQFKDYMLQKRKMERESRLPSGLLEMSGSFADLEKKVKATIDQTMNRGSASKGGYFQAHQERKRMRQRSKDSFFRRKSSKRDAVDVTRILDSTLRQSPGLDEAQPEQQTPDKKKAGESAGNSEEQREIAKELLDILISNSKIDMSFEFDSHKKPTEPEPEPETETEPKAKVQTRTNTLKRKKKDLRRINRKEEHRQMIRKRVQATQNHIRSIRGEEDPNQRQVEQMLDNESRELVRRELENGIDSFRAESGRPRDIKNQSKLRSKLENHLQMGRMSSMSRPMEQASGRGADRDSMLVLEQDETILLEELKQLGYRSPPANRGGRSEMVVKKSLEMLNQRLVQIDSKPVIKTRKSRIRLEPMRPATREQSRNNFDQSPLKSLDKPSEKFSDLLEYELSRIVQSGSEHKQSAKPVLKVLDLEAGGGDRQERPKEGTSTALLKEVREIIDKYQRKKEGPRDNSFKYKWEAQKLGDLSKIEKPSFNNETNIMSILPDFFKDPEFSEKKENFVLNSQIEQSKSRYSRIGESRLRKRNQKISGLGPYQRGSLRGQQRTGKIVTNPENLRRFLE